MFGFIEDFFSKDKEYNAVEGAAQAKINPYTNFYQDPSVRTAVSSLEYNSNDYNKTSDSAVLTLRLLSERANNKAGSISNGSPAMYRQYIADKYKEANSSLLKGADMDKLEQAFKNPSESANARKYAVDELGRIMKELDVSAYNPDKTLKSSQDIFSELAQKYDTKQNEVYEEITSDIKQGLFKANEGVAKTIDAGASLLSLGLDKLGVGKANIEQMNKMQQSNVTSESSHGFLANSLTFLPDIAVAALGGGIAKPLATSLANTAVRGAVTKGATEIIAGKAAEKVVANSMAKTATTFIAEALGASAAVAGVESLAKGTNYSDEFVNDLAFSFLGYAGVKAVGSLGGKIVGASNKKIANMAINNALDNIGISGEARSSLRSKLLDISKSLSDKVSVKAVQNTSAIKAITKSVENAADVFKRAEKIDVTPYKLKKFVEKNYNTTTKELTNKAYNDALQELETQVKQSARDGFTPEYNFKVDNFVEQYSAVIPKLLKGTSLKAEVFSMSPDKILKELEKYEASENGGFAATALKKVFEKAMSDADMLSSATRNISKNYSDPLHNTIVSVDKNRLIDLVFHNIKNDISAKGSIYKVKQAVAATSNYIKSIGRNEFDNPISNNASTWDRNFKFLMGKESDYKLAKDAEAKVAKAYDSLNLQRDVAIEKFFNNKISTVEDVVNGIKNVTKYGEELVIKVNKISDSRINSFQNAVQVSLQGSNKAIALIRHDKYMIAASNTIAEIDPKLSTKEREYIFDKIEDIGKWKDKATGELVDADTLAEIDAKKIIDRDGVITNYDEVYDGLYQEDAFTVGMKIIEDMKHLDSNGKNYAYEYFNAIQGLSKRLDDIQEKVGLISSDLIKDERYLTTVLVTKDGKALLKEHTDAIKAEKDMPVDVVIPDIIRGKDLGVGNRKEVRKFKNADERDAYFSNSKNPLLREIKTLRDPVRSLQYLIQTIEPKIKDINLAQELHFLADIDTGVRTGYNFEKMKNIKKQFSDTFKRTIGRATESSNKEVIQTIENAAAQTDELFRPLTFEEVESMLSDAIRVSDLTFEAADDIMLTSTSKDLSHTDTFFSIINNNLENWKAGNKITDKTADEIKELIDVYKKEIKDINDNAIANMADLAKKGFMDAGVIDKKLRGVYLDKNNFAALSRIKADDSFKKGSPLDIFHQAVKGARNLLATADVFFTYKSVFAAYETGGLKRGKEQFFDNMRTLYKGDDAIDKEFVNDIVEYSDALGVFGSEFTKGSQTLKEIAQSNTLLGNLARKNFSFNPFKGIQKISEKIESWNYKQFDLMMLSAKTKLVKNYEEEFMGKGFSKNDARVKAASIAHDMFSGQNWENLIASTNSMLTNQSLKIGQLVLFAPDFFLTKLRRPLLAAKSFELGTMEGALSRKILINQAGAYLVGLQLLHNVFRGMEWVADGNDPKEYKPTFTWDDASAPFLSVKLPFMETMKGQGVYTNPFGFTGQVANTFGSGVSSIKNQLSQPLKMVANTYTNDNSIFANLVDSAFMSTQDLSHYLLETTTENEWYDTKTSAWSAGVSTILNSVGLETSIPKSEKDYQTLYDLFNGNPEVQGQNVFKKIWNGLSNKKIKTPTEQLGAEGKTDFERVASIMESKEPEKTFASVMDITSDKSSQSRIRNLAMGKLLSDYMKKGGSMQDGISYVKGQMRRVNEFDDSSATDQSIIDNASSYLLGAKLSREQLKNIYAIGINPIDFVNKKYTNEQMLRALDMVSHKVCERGDKECEKGTITKEQYKAIRKKLDL